MRRFRSVFLIFLFLLLYGTVSSAAAFSRTVFGIVTRVSDGDTIQIITPEQTKLKVRLYGIDAPETAKPNKLGQPYGEESWEALESKVMGKQVHLKILDIDKYRRMVGMIWLDDRNINLEMVREGYAEAFTEYLKPPYRAQFLKAEQQAKSEKIGIWSLQKYERPRAFRKKFNLD